MNDRAFLDTNIFIYAAGGKDSKSQIADRLIEQAIQRGNGVISYQVIQEFLNVAIRKFATPFSAELARMYMSVTFRPIYTVQSSPGLYSDAIGIWSHHRLSWYDSLIVAAASEAGCSVLYSEDLNHGEKINGVRIENPFRTN